MAAHISPSACGGRGHVRRTLGSMGRRWSEAQPDAPQASIGAVVFVASALAIAAVWILSLA
jgi:hypothetical protein